MTGLGWGMGVGDLTKQITTNLIPSPSSIKTGEDRHAFQVVLIAASIVAMGDDEAWRPPLRQYPVMQEGVHVQTQQQSTVILSHTRRVSLSTLARLRPLT